MKSWFVIAMVFAIAVTPCAQSHSKTGTQSRIRDGFVHIQNIESAIQRNTSTRFTTEINIINVFVAATMKRLPTCAELKGAHELAAPDY